MQRSFQLPSTPNFSNDAKGFPLLSGAQTFMNTFPQTGEDNQIIYNENKMLFKLIQPTVIDTKMGVNSAASALTGCILL